MFSRTMRAVGAAAIGLVTIAGGVTGGAATAGAATSRGHHAAPRYLALGDSIAFGFSPLLADPWVPDNFVGYPEIIDQRTRLTTTNLACPGQTAEALVSLDALDTGCFEMRAEAKQQGFELLHTKYARTQLDAALFAVRSDRKPTLISIQGGGNEISYCLDDPDPDQCLNDLLPKVHASLHQVVLHLRAAGYQGRIVMVGYHLVPEIKPQIRRINGVIRQVARRTHAAYADTASRFEAYAQSHHGDLCTTGLLIKLPDDSCDLHPTAAGQRLYAKTVLEAAYGNGH